MARVLKLVDSEAVLSDISLIAPTTIQLTKKGMGDLELDGSQVDFSSPSGWEKILETYKLNLYGSSQDNAASQMQALNKMLRKAAQYFKTPWQSYPVYLQEQQATETSARYAIVFGAKSVSVPDLYDSPFEVDSRLEGLKVELFREHPWRGTVPGTVPTALTLTKTDAQADRADVFIANCLHTQTITHIYNYDASLTAWSSNLAGTTGYPIWSVAGSTPAAGDMHYVGSNSRVFFNYIVNLVTAGVFTADVRLQAYISGAWTDLGFGDTAFSTRKLMGVYPPMWIGSSPSGSFQVTGQNAYSWLIKNWQTVLINGVTAYWVRFNLNAVTGWTTTPTSHATETPYSQRKPYFSIPNTAIGGDAPPRLRFALAGLYGGSWTSLTVPNPLSTNRTIIAAKSTNKWLTNLDDFASHINCSQYPPTGWARTLGTDAADVATSVTSPEGATTLVNFATVTAMTNRLTLTGTGKWPKYKGSYRMFLICYQVGGAAGDLAVNVRIRHAGTGDSDPSAFSDTYTLKAADSDGWEVCDLGLVSIPFTPPVSYDTLSGDLIFQIRAQRLAGSATLSVQQLILLPVDEYYEQLDDPQKDINGTSSLRSSANNAWPTLISDHDVVARRANLATDATIVTDAWHSTVSINRIEPGRAYRFYCLMMQYNKAFGTGPFVLEAGGGILRVSVAAVNSYATLRGAG